MSLRYRVANASMLPTLQPGDRVLVDRLVFHLRPPRRGEIVIVRHPELGGMDAVKRVVGLPAERVALRNGELLVGDVPVAEPYLEGQLRVHESRTWVLDRGQFLVFGDNRGDSRDSRHFGPLERASFRGLVWHRYWPRARTAIQSG